MQASNRCRKQAIVGYSETVIMRPQGFSRVGAQFIVPASLTQGRCVHIQKANVHSWLNFKGAQQLKEREFCMI